MMKNNNNNSNNNPELLSPSAGDDVRSGGCWESDVGTTDSVSRQTDTRASPLPLLSFLNLRFQQSCVKTKQSKERNEPQQFGLRRQ